MKKLLFVFILLTSACERTKLPAPTKEGADTFGMLVNGAKWIAYTPGLFTPGGIGADIYFNKKYSTLEISARNKNADQNIYFSIKINGVGTYNFNKAFREAMNTGNIEDSINCKFKTRFEYSSDCFNSYFLTDSLKSKIIITKMDSTLEIVSGTFFMTLYNSAGTELKITDGRFDSNYTK
jgi:hypothetical protein